MNDMLDELNKIVPDLDENDKNKIYDGINVKESHKGISFFKKQYGLVLLGLALLAAIIVPIGIVLGNSNNQKIADPSTVTPSNGNKGGNTNGNIQLSDEEKRATYTKAYEQVANSMAPVSINLTSNKITDANCSLKIENDNAREDKVLNNDQGTRAYVYLLHLLYENENFPITDSIVKYTCNDIPGKPSYQNYEMNQLSSLDIENNKITSQLYATSYDSPTSYDFYYGYIYLDIDYNFKTNTMESFDIIFKTVKDNNPQIALVERYENGIMYEFYDYMDSVKEMVSEITDKPYSEFISNLPNAIDAGDFSDEFIAANNYVFDEGNN